MLARNKSVELVRLGIHQLKRLIELLLPLCLVKFILADVDVQVAVTCVAEAGDADVKLLGYLVSILDEVGNAVARYDNVAFIHFGGGRLDRLKEGSPRLPDRVLALLGINDEGIGCAALHTKLGDVGQFVLDRSLVVAVDRQQEVSRA